MPSPSLHPCLRWLFQWRMGLVLLFAPLLLTGCVDYGINIHFHHPNRGEIVQHIQLGERLSSLGGVAIQDWLQTIEHRSRSLGGKVKRLSDQEMIVQIPFGSSDELATKFNQFFHPAAQDRSNAEGTTLPEIDSHLSVSHSNFLLLERDHLTYDLDVRSLGVTAADGNVLVSPTSLIALEFRLNTPWGAQSSIAAPDVLQPIASPDGTQLLWRLVPGDKNHLEATFWMPNWLGIGTVIILLVVGLGIYLKYPRGANKPVATPG
ncbi:DUF3153 domain-containing protein [Pantanalinema sp. GBBB05]|uniref:DUF3153 domain-containing protein n=1 Tax=Pantanalinema sp. GBBB05 TaxID=2604139 RepID=UPI001D97E14D|nr:DUF3153 domain-containing protein [Pantanalinema sp. GBBB05]